MTFLNKKFIFLIFCFPLHFHSVAQTPGSLLFNYNGIHDLYLTFTQQNFWDSLIYYKEEGDISGSYTYMPVTINLDGLTLSSVGIRMKGNSSFMAPGVKKSFKLDFNRFVPGQKLYGLKKLNLNNCFNDPTLMREKLFLDILQNSGINAPRCIYTRIYINNVYWGLYNMVDDIDKVFLKSRYINDSGVLFKGDKEPWMTCANLSYHSDPMEYRNCYTLETNTDLNNWSDLENLIDVINNTPQNLFFSSLQNVLNTSSFIISWAANIVFVNVDSYVQTGHNYFIYHNPVNSKFEWITWDVNEAFGLWNVGMPLSQLYNLDIFYLPDNPQIERPLSYFMLQDSLFRKQYTDKLYEMVCNVFKPSVLYPIIDSLYIMIKPDVYADTNKIIGNVYFEENINDDVEIQGYPGWVPGLKKFIQERRDTLIKQLEAIGYLFSGTESDIIHAENFLIYPNPATEFISLQGKDIESVEILSIEGKSIIKLNEPNEKYDINVSTYAEGMYFLKIMTVDRIIVEKIYICNH